ncbi:hypothetical protein DVB69_15545 [Sporosarcina sp. BI001-red]|uniref:SWIM zinc finger family protein n=1 Tax=Sporosarcina sp. BI001-red TaxID=2282866 RepID=UPI000E27B015|nr:hypothetical protein [Sporosarcina sp. BI001-red]REB05177.1 hypothetical protein DVB69_15545 [Sporosarcina sp. BI001-red]
MKLLTFEENIRNVILKRGMTYYREGRVDNVVEMPGNRFAGVVAGSEVYEVDCKVDSSGVILYSYCTCPYDLSSVCKHEVAFYLYLRNTLEVVKDSGEKDGAGMRRVLLDVPKSELVDLLMLLADEDDEILLEIHRFLER